MRITAVTSKPFNIVILSEAKLQRSPESFRGEGQAFHLGSVAPDRDVKPEMFESLASCFAFRCSALLNMTSRFQR
jgi:hypothetical protein